ncbi:hypothetical protein [Paenibacillus hamazuiensis]|uniref:hypothetical protein n=1 Tax=Paenibacillus hamazuiensis TaxID=2936508 RepID=UPI00200CDBD1|nr:hypothetical protein [Paenibacillus hamazuiensis]
MTLSDFVTEMEYRDAMDGVKDLLKETYQLTEDEAVSVIRRSREKADQYLYDYMPYIEYIREVRHHLRDTLDAHFEKTVDPEKELPLKMSNDAAVWLTFECIRRFCKKSLTDV